MKELKTIPVRLSGKPEGYRSVGVLEGPYEYVAVIKVPEDYSVKCIIDWDDEKSMNEWDRIRRTIYCICSSRDGSELIAERWRSYDARPQVRFSGRDLSELTGSDNVSELDPMEIAESLKKFFPEKLER